VVARPVAAAGIAAIALPQRAVSQQRDSLHDTLQVYTLAPVTVSVTRANSR